MSIADWRINGFTPEAFGVDDIEITKQNMDDDYAVLKLRGDFSQDIHADLAVGKPVLITYLGYAALRGKVDQPLRQASGVSQSRSVFVYGPWHYLAKTPWVFSFPYADGNVDTTHAVIEGSAATLITTLIARAVAAGLIASTGNDYNFTNFNIPRSESYNLTLADGFRAVMRLLPGGTLGFNYTTDPPRMVILGPTSAYLTTFNPLLANCSDLTLKSRDDLLLDGVRLDYEAAETRKTRTWRHPFYAAPSDVTETTYGGSRYISADASGSTSGRVFRETIQLSGSRTVTTLDWAVGLWSSNPLSDLYSVDNWAAVNLFFKFNSRNYGSGYSGKPAGATLSMVLTPISAGFTVPTSAGTAANWLFLARTGADGAGPIFDNFALRKYPEEILYSDSYTAGLKVLQADCELKFTIAGVEKTYLATAFFAYGSGGDRTGTRQIIDGEVEAAPSGIAAQILAKYADLQHEGSVVVDVDDNPLAALGYVGGPHRIAFTTPAVTAAIQRRTFAVSSGLASIAFGTPQHLGPQDLLALYRAKRK